MAKGGIILHGEQEFLYHRPVFVGDVLVGEGHVVDAYTKESKGKTMTFIVTETVCARRRPPATPWSRRASRMYSPGLNRSGPGPARRR